jgi:hypothetical protein
MISLSAFPEVKFDSHRSPLSRAPHYGIYSLQLLEHTSTSFHECAVRILWKYEQELAILHNLKSILQQTRPGLYELGPHVWIRILYTLLKREKVTRAQKSSRGLELYHLQGSEKISTDSS